MVGTDSHLLELRLKWYSRQRTETGTEELKTVQSQLKRFERMELLKQFSSLFFD